MKSLLKIAVFTLLSFPASQVMAAPIGDGSFSTYGASWVTSSGTVCSTVCKEKRARAESIKLSHASTQDIFVCRVFLKNFNQYGTNSSDNCMYYNTNTRAGKKAEKFQCLCVTRPNK